MIDISGDIIYFDNRPVGFIIIPNGTMRDRFEEALMYDSTEEVERISAQLKCESDLHADTSEELDEAETKISRALRYAEDESEPDWQKLIEILS